MSEFHQSTFRYPDSYVKTLHQIADLATEPVQIGSKIINTDLPALRRLLRWAEYFNILTKLPMVIEYLEAGNLEPRRF